MFEHVFFFALIMLLANVSIVVVPAGGRGGAAVELEAVAGVIHKVRYRWYRILTIIHVGGTLITQSIAT